MEKGVLLCVDDEIIVLTALKDQLRRAFGSDFLIDVAESAEEALELLDELLVSLCCDDAALSLVICEVAAVSVLSDFLFAATTAATTTTAITNIASTVMISWRCPSFFAGCWSM